MLYEFGDSGRDGQVGSDVEVERADRAEDGLNHFVREDSHCPLVRSAATDLWEDAAELNSLASPTRAAEAASIGPEPGPLHIPAQLIAGGRTANSIFESFAA